MSTPRARHFGRVNTIGLFTLWWREVRVGLRLWMLTLGGPALRAVLFAAVFAIAIEGRVAMAGSLGFMEFLLPGLVAAAIIERSFESTSLTIVYGKLEGVIADVVGAPLTSAETLLGYVLAALTGGLMSGVAVWIVLLPFGIGMPARPLVLILFATLAALMVGPFALLSAIWAEKWDHISAVQTFVFLPIVFLSGIFFSIERLPPLGQRIARANPMHYAIDGIRFGFTGRAELNPTIGVVLLLAVDAALLLACYAVLRSGYKLKQ